MRSLKAHFLIAMPAMGDPNFNETVTYLCKHDAEGALGIVINRPTEMILDEIFQQLELETTDKQLADQAVLSGGPLRPDRGFVLHRSATEYDSTLDTGTGVQLTVSQDILGSLAMGEGPSPAIVALGYANWEAGQLEAEMASNAWLSVPADETVLFETPYEQRWAAAAGLIGVNIHQLTSYAGHA